MIGDRQTERVEHLVEAHLAELFIELRGMGLDPAGVGLSLYLVEADDCVSQHMAVGGDAAQVGQFAPDWPFLLSAELFEGPHKLFCDLQEAASGAAPVYRLKPLAIEAVRFDGIETVDESLTPMFDGSFGPHPDWLADAMAKREGEDGAVWWDDVAVVIDTPRGELRAAPGDWIVRGETGDLHPVKPDVFAATVDIPGARS